MAVLKDIFSGAFMQDLVVDGNKPYKI